MIELVISAAIGSIVLISAYACLRAGLSGQSMIDARADAVQGARVALGLMTGDLRCATPLSTDFDFLGGQRTIKGALASNVDFATHNYSPRAEREGDICEISYFLDPNPETGTLSLWRRRDPSPDPQPLMGGGREEIAQNVTAFGLGYYDGFEWFNTWGDAEGKYEGVNTAQLASNAYGMPEAVRITINLSSNPVVRKSDTKEDEDESAGTELTFQTVVRLDLAAISYSMSRASSSGEGGEGN